MTVQVQRGGHRRMSGPLARDLRVDALAQKVRDVRVAEAVERDRSDPGLPHEIAKLTAELVRWPRPPISIGMSAWGQQQTSSKIVSDVRF